MRHPTTVTATVTVTEFKSGLGLGLGLGNGLSPSRPDTRDDMGGTKMWNFSRPRPQPATRKYRSCTTALVVCLQHYNRTSQHYLATPVRMLPNGLGGRNLASGWVGEPEPEPQPEPEPECEIRARYRYRCRYRTCRIRTKTAKLQSKYPSA